MYQATLPTIEQNSPWRIVLDGYRPAAQMYQRHYSCHQYKDDRRTNGNYRNRNLIMGPGEKRLLMTEQNDALFGWRKFVSDDDQEGVNCSVFRNESVHLSSWLITEAMKIAWQRWPGERLYTYVAPDKIRRNNERHRKNRPAGYCFIKAGWRECGVTKANKLLIFEYVPTSEFVVNGDLPLPEWCNA